MKTREIDFDAEGLLAGLESSEERSERLELLKELTRIGVKLSDIKRAVAEDRLAVLPVEFVYWRDCSITARQMLNAVGLEEAFVRRNYLALGLAFPGLDEPTFSEEDLDGWRMLKAVVDAGVPEAALLEIGRVMGRTAPAIAESVLECVLPTFLQQGVTERDVGLRLAKAATDLTPALGPLTAGPVRWHLRERVRHQVIGESERITGTLPGSRQIAVCFADLVGFTKAALHSDAATLAEMTAQFGALAAEVAAPPVRLIKLIGDAAMLVSPDPVALVQAAAALIAEVSAEPSLPPLRAGAAIGIALSRGGDWYGPPVNLASRICEVAAPEALIGTSDLVEACRRHCGWETAGTGDLRGFEGPVELFRLTAARADAS